MSYLNYNLPSYSVRDIATATLEIANYNRIINRSSSTYFSPKNNSDLRFFAELYPTEWEKGTPYSDLVRIQLRTEGKDRFEMDVQWSISIIDPSGNKTFTRGKQSVFETVNLILII